MNKKLLMLLCVLAVCAGCGGRQPLTRDEWLAMTHRTFEGTTVDQVLRAGDRVLRLCDSSDVSLQHQPTKLSASRKYLVYMVLAAAMGSFNFDLSAAQNGTDVDAYLYIGHSSTPIMAVPTYTPGVQGGLGGAGATAGAGVAVGDPVEAREVYELFFLRMDSILNGTPWITCEAAKDVFPNRRVAGLDALCLMADDVDPFAPVSETKPSVVY